jgi:glycosyltransferase involved in cell wall biosynthesis
MNISIIIPCFNEVLTIEKVVRNVKNFVESYDYEIIIIDDGSTDGTREIINNKLDKSNIKIYLNDKNYGKGFSVRKGIELSSKEIILIQDADLEYDPSDYKKLLKPIIKNNADVVFGSRFVGSSEKRVLYFWHRLGNLFLTILSNMCSNLNLTDMENGYKVFKKDSIKNINLKENRFGFEPEITAKIAKKNLKIYEVGVKYYGRKYSEGKKITWKDGFSALRCIIYYNFFSN